MKIPVDFHGESTGTHKRKREKKKGFNFLGEELQCWCCSTLLDAYI